MEITIEKKISQLMQEYIVKKAKLDVNYGILKGENTELFEELMFLRESVLAYFGLPVSDDHEDFLDSVKFDEIDDWIEWMKGEAENYIKSTPRPHLEILQTAQKFNSDRDEVLPEFRLTNHVFIQFIYDVKLLKNKADARLVLHDFKILQGDSFEILDSLGRIACNVDEEFDEELMTKLRVENLVFLDDFYQYVLTEYRPEQRRLFYDLLREKHSDPMAKIQNCPICASEVEINRRFPLYVCHDCERKASDENGKLVSFGNIDFSGGIEGCYVDSNQEYKSQICYIKGHRCIAKEGKFGGVFIVLDLL